MILSPFVLKENWAWYKAVSVFAALIGLVFIMNPGDGMLLDWSSTWIGDRLWFISRIPLCERHITQSIYKGYPRF